MVETPPHTFTMRYYSLRCDLKAAACNEDIVILDLSADRFHILNNLSADRLTAALSGEDEPLVLALHEAGLIENSDRPMSLSSHHTKGFFEQRWMTPIIDATCSWSDRLRATAEVIRTNRLLQNTTIQNLIAELQKFPKVDSRRPSGDLKIASLMSALNAAFSLDRTKNQCLAYSYSLVRMARRLNIPASLVIGVKTKPFLSHAWVEFQGEVINDDRHLREKLSVIAES